MVRSGPSTRLDEWFETSNEIGLNGAYARTPRNYGTFTAVSAACTRSPRAAPTAPCATAPSNHHKYSLESGYLAWRSGDLFPQLGVNALELSGGNQNYQVFDGLLFWDGGQDCAERGGNWVSPRKAFRETGILRLKLKNFTFEGVHLKYNDDPNTETRLGAARIEYVTDDSFMEHLKLGAMYFNIYDSETATRDGMDGVYLYTEATPLRVLPDLTTKASFVRESNSDSPAVVGLVVRRPRLQALEAALDARAQLPLRVVQRRQHQRVRLALHGLPDWGTGSRESCSASSCSPTAT